MGCSYTEFGLLGGKIAARFRVDSFASGSEQVWPGMTWVWPWPG